MWWAAAFGDRPELDLRATPADPGERWLSAVALGGRGFYAAATALLQPLIFGRASVIAALAAATLASHRRQLGGHAAARRLDAFAARRLADAGPPACEDHLGRPGMDLRAARSDVLLGLAADAVGLGRTAEARALFGIESASHDAGWRAVIRRSWVAAEIELGAGSPWAAVAPAIAAASAAAASDSVRHQVKSALVLGAALAAAGDHDEARKTITDAHARATARGLLPLVWPCALVLADLDPERADEHRAEAVTALDCVLRHSDPVGRKLADASPWVPTWLFTSAPNR